MSFLKVYKDVLDDAANREVKKSVDEKDGDYFLALKELFEDGYVHAVDEGTLEGESFRNIRISVKGREYLEELDKRFYEASWRPKAKFFLFNIVYWAAGVLSGVLIMRIG